MIEINLLPGVKKKGKGKGASFQLPDFKNLGGLVKDPWLLAFIGSWVLVAALLALFYLPRRARLSDLEPRLAAANREALRMRQVLALKRQYEARRESLLSQIEVIASIDRERYVWPHILQAVTRALPQYTWVDDMTSRQAADTDSGSSLGTAFQLTGKSADIQAVTRFVRNLEDSPFLTNVATISTGSTNEQGRDVYTYVVTAQYSHPDTSLLTMQPLSTTLVSGVRSGGGRRR